MNETLLISSLIITYSAVLIFYKFLGKTGLYVWTAIATIIANIEVLILIHAFGMNQTLGNILFASTFLVTDILSEKYGEKAALKSVKIGIISNLVFVLTSKFWLLYAPLDGTEEVMKNITAVFSLVPRMMIVGIAVYAISQTFDVWMYQKMRNITDRIFEKNSEKGLWIRNNGSTLISQLINTCLFTLGAFWGTYDIHTLLSILVSSYIIFVFTSLLDTPFVYFAKRITPNSTPQ